MSPQLALTLLLMLLVSGCGGVCLEPGKGISSNSVEIKVPVQPPGASRKNPVTYWVHSGRAVESDKELKLTVENTISLCPKDASTAAVVKMFPEDLVGKRPEHEFYDTLLDVVKGDRVEFSPFLHSLSLPSCDKIEHEESFVIYHGGSDLYKDKDCKQGIPAKDLCSSGAYGGSGLLYIKSDGEQNNSSSKCQEVPAGLTLPRIGGSKAETLRLGFPIGYMARFKRITDNGRELLEASSKYAVATGRIYDARTIRTRYREFTTDFCSELKTGYVTKKIQERTLADFKRLESIEYSLNDKDEQKTRQPAVSPPKYEKYKEMLKEYTEYDISCNCGMICKPSDKIDSEECTRSIVQIVGDELTCPTAKPAKAESVPSEIADDEASMEAAMKQYLPASMKLGGKGEAVEPNTYELAEGAAATVLPTPSSTGTASQTVDIRKNGCSTAGCKWIPESAGSSGNTFLNSSLKMYEKYEVPESGRLFLTYLGKRNSANTAAGTNSAQQSVDYEMSGFYSLRVHRTCYSTAGKKLYMYIGTTPPDFLPGQGGSEKEVELDLEQQNPKGSFVINKKGNGTGKTGNIYYGIAVDEKYDGQLKDNNYPDNYYSVRLWLPTWEPIFSQFFAKLQGVLMNVLYGVTLPDDGYPCDISKAIRESAAKGQEGAIQKIYKGQTTSKPFWMAIQALLTLYLLFSALGYILGVIKITKYDLAVRVAKIAFLVSLFSPTSWQFFNEHCFQLFVGGVSEIITAFSGYLDGDSSFKFLDATLGILLTAELWLRLLALLIAGPVGWLAFIGVVWALVSFFLAMIQAMIMYLFVIITIAFLLTLAPIFFAFLLFQKTAQLFQGWLKMLVNFSLQPIILFASLAFLNQLILTSLHEVTDFTACENCAIGINIPSDDPGVPSRPDICLLPVMLPIGFSNELSIEDRQREGLARDDIGFMGLPFGVAVVLTLVICCTAIKEFVKISEILAHSISGSVASAAGSAMGAMQSMLSVAGLDSATQQRIAAARNMVTPGTDKVQFEGREGGAAAAQEGAEHAERGEAGGSVARAQVLSDSDAAAGGKGGAGGDDRAHMVGVPDVPVGGGPFGEDVASGAGDSVARAQMLSGADAAAGGKSGACGDDRAHMVGVPDVPVGGGPLGEDVASGAGGSAAGGEEGEVAGMGAPSTYDSDEPDGPPASDEQPHVEDLLSGAGDADGPAGMVGSHEEEWAPEQQDEPRADEQDVPDYRDDVAHASVDNVGGEVTPQEAVDHVMPDDAGDQGIMYSPEGDTRTHASVVDHDVVSPGTADSGVSRGEQESRGDEEVTRTTGGTGEVIGDEIGEDHSGDSDGQGIEEKLSKSPDNEGPGEVQDEE
ncbi:MAG: type IV secretion system protein [Anaplasma sp.]